MSSTDPLDCIRKAINEGMNTAEGHDAIVGVKVLDLMSLMRAANEQESELIKAEDTLVRVKEWFGQIEDSLSYQSIDEVIPPDTPEDSADLLYEVYVAEDAESSGRMFAFWDSEEAVFYRFVGGLTEETSEIQVLEDVTHWRDTLANPEEAVDLTGPFEELFK